MEMTDPTKGNETNASTWAATASPSPYHPYRRAEEKPLRPASWEENEETMKVIPNGKISSAYPFRAPVVTEAKADSPRCATISASANPTTACVDREIIIGQANESN